ncbi:hypothetical protein TRAPUB_1752 [Trametes pubescens]|uniref:Uncharacterized protein n=1 Tax=Trametes pubescens TaxID=154538 RepID=A0A1M2VIM8_TRAPU|nr:hypothetical protein TRAPUB_1752 [Trametes pubescens]
MEAGTGTCLLAEQDNVDEPSVIWAARPCFASIDCSTGVLNEEQPEVAPHLAKYFPNGRGRYILHYDKNMSVISKAYHIYYSIPSYTGLTDPNDAIYSLVHDTPGFAGAKWPGTVVVFKFADSTCTIYENMDESDVENIKIHFALFGRRRG